VPLLFRIEAPCAGNGRPLPGKGTKSRDSGGRSLRAGGWAATLVLAAFLLTACVSEATNKACAKQNCVGGINPEKAGFLVVAPDRGYAGNQKTRMAFKALNDKYNAELLFATDERMRPYLKEALKNLNRRNAKQIIVLPLFLSTSHPGLAMFRSMLLEEAGSEDTIYARAFGGSYLSVEMFADRLREIDLGDNPIIIAGYGATTKESQTLMQRDVHRIAEQSMESAGKKNLVITYIWPGGKHDETREAQEKAAWDWIKKNAKHPKNGTRLLLPFHLGTELDGMMNFNAALGYRKPEGLQLIDYKDNEVDFTTLWMQREANRYLATSVGIVFNAHGSDFHWNQTMRDAVADLAKDIPIEFAFSMADPDDLRKAVKRLEKRGVGAIVIVRVFGMQTSFRHATERLIGLDIDAPELCLPDDGNSMRMPDPPPERLRTTSLVVTEGGLGDSPLFAKALYERAIELSSAPSDDTVILVAHGKGSDEANEQWLKVLESLSRQINELSDGKFKTIQYQTWQEDWEDKRGTRINAVKQMVKETQAGNGTAIIIPARTTGEGPTKKFLGEMNYKSGSGFAPHPLFSKWVKQQMEIGIETLKQTRHVWYPALDQTQKGKL
ncbi:MAG TPA: hypothetical protein EYP51_02225, partial [Thiotrichales bacterium]|nr:hypothetical protein [Thiotrichales bacterium]